MKTIAVLANGNLLVELAPDAVAKLNSLAALADSLAVPPPERPEDLFDLPKNPPTPVRTGRQAGKNSSLTPARNTAQSGKKQQVSASASKKPSPTGRPSPIRDAAIAVLSKGNPLTAAAIVLALKKAGVKFEAKNPLGSIHSLLSANKSIFRTVSRGLWTLASRAGKAVVLSPADRLQKIREADDRVERRLAEKNPLDRAAELHSKLAAEEA